MQGARRRCRWCCRTLRDEPHYFLFSNEEIWHLCEALRLISSSPLYPSLLPEPSTFSTLSTPSTSIFSSTGVPLLKIQQLTAPEVWCAPCFIASAGKSNAENL